MTKNKRKIKENAVSSAVEKANIWLSPFGLCLEAESRKKGDGRLGEYEAGSIFEKTIQVVIYTDAIAESCADEREFEREFLPFSELSDEEDQIKLTIYHELGHALVEQIIDWMENLPEAAEIFTDDLCQKYHSVVDGEFDEETLVENFAYAFMYGDDDEPLKSCFKELNNIFQTS